MRASYYYAERHVVCVKSRRGGCGGGANVPDERPLFITNGANDVQVLLAEPFCHAVPGVTSGLAPGGAACSRCRTVRAESRLAGDSHGQSGTRAENASGAAKQRGARSQGRRRGAPAREGQGGR